MEVERSTLNIPIALIRYFVALREQLVELGEPQQGQYLVPLPPQLRPVSARAWDWLLDVLAAHYYAQRLSEAWWLGERQNEVDPEVAIPLTSGLRMMDLQRAELAALLCAVDFYDVTMLRQLLVARLAEKFMAESFGDVEASFVPRNAVEQVLLPVASARHRDQRWLREALGSLDLVSAVTHCWPQLGPLLATGTDHTLIVTREGLWGCGNSTHFELGFEDHFDSRLPESLVPRQMMLRYVVAVACGHTFSMALTASGSLWSCGLDEHGQLGRGPLPPADGHEWSPVRSDVVAVSCGAYHTLIITGDGSVWSCGRNDVGQLGTTDTQRRDVFAKVTGLPGRALQVSCGKKHSAILTTAGLYMCGDNRQGQLGVPRVGAVPVLSGDPWHRARAVWRQAHCVSDTRRPLGLWQRRRLSARSEESCCASHQDL